MTLFTPQWAGIGLRSPHFTELLAQLPPLAFLEVHSENYFAEGGTALAWLTRFRAHYPISLHGVGLSLGSADDRVEAAHLAALKRLVDRIEPLFVSDHVSWSSFQGQHLGELLPIPYTEESLEKMCAHVDQVQEALNRPILIENVSAYLRYQHSTIPEGEFIAEVIRRTGCGMVLDVNNAWVNAVNHGTVLEDFLAPLNPETIQEIHLAGYEITEQGLLDTHGAPVFPEVWAAYEHIVDRIGKRPTLIEWDNDLPDLAVLLAEAQRANHLLEKTEIAPFQIDKAS